MPNSSSLSKIKKRNGDIVAFDPSKIATAIYKAMDAVNEGTKKDAESIAEKVASKLKSKFRSGGTAEIELVQDYVEKELILADCFKVAKQYMIYRVERDALRNKVKDIPENIKKLAEDSKKYFKNPLGEFIFYRTYSRWIVDEQRRETWIETVDRYISFMKENLKDKISKDEYAEIREAILNLEVMPSMRLLWSSGEAARISNVSAYNCSYVAPTALQDFGEIMYILMSGTGVGFSVEEKTVNELPKIRKQKGEPEIKHLVEDSKEGWADALVAGMEAWFSGKDITFDFSKLRPAGARLKTMGGRSSGPEPLKDCLTFVKAKILNRQEKRLKPIDVHDIICKIGEVVVCGGVRRSALISLSNLDDVEMRAAKMGTFQFTQPQRSMANNSAVYLEKPTSEKFLEEWISLVKSGTGERGIFNRFSLDQMLPKRRVKLGKDYLELMGTNPCGEIILRSKQFCNLTEVIARPEDTIETLTKKVRIATILGTYQSTLTNFPYLSSDWKKNCKEERLLGVSITGQWDCPLATSDVILGQLKNIAIETNETYANRLGISESSCITCVKPSGTVSQLVNAASGLHPRYSKYYIRRVRISSTDPLFRMLKDQKVPYHPEVGQVDGLATTYVLEFPVKSPENSTTRNSLTALQQLEHWKNVKINYCEHNPSVTIYVNDTEWIDVANWVYNNWDIIGGLSFLPKDRHIYSLAPFEEITKEDYDKMMETFPDIDCSRILIYEKEDETKGSHELACVAGICEI